MQRIEKIDYRVKKILPFYMGVVFSITVLGAVVGYFMHDPWKMGDWLINYSGGFVRRGFSGELFMWMSSITSADPGAFVVVFQITFYAIYFLYAYKLLKESNTAAYLLLIFSPFVFMFQLNDFFGGYRKEIIYFAALSYLTYSKLHKDQRCFENRFYVVLVFYSFAVLSHEFLAVFIPYLLVVYLWGMKIAKTTLLRITLATLPATISFLFSVAYTGGAEQGDLIFASLSSAGYELKGGMISWLHLSAAEGKDALFGMINKYVVYAVVLPLSLVAFIPVWPRIKHILSEKMFAFLIVVSLLGTIIVATVATDWGRFIYIHLVSFFILSFIVGQKKINIDLLQKINGFSAITFTCLFVLSVFWALSFRVPHCCGVQAVATAPGDLNYIRSLSVISQYREKQKETQPVNEVSPSL